MVAVIPVVIPVEITVIPADIKDIPADILVAITQPHMVRIEERYWNDIMYQCRK